MNITAIIVSILALVLIVVLVRNLRRESFGTSPGTLVQLASTHVPKWDEEIADRAAEMAQIRHDLIDMTGGY